MQGLFLRFNIFCVCVCLCVFNSDVIKELLETASREPHVLKAGRGGARDWNLRTTSGVCFPVSRGSPSKSFKSKSGDRGPLGEETSPANALLFAFCLLALQLTQRLLRLELQQDQRDACSPRAARIPLTEPSAANTSGLMQRSCYVSSLLFKKMQVPACDRCMQGFPKTVLLIAGDLLSSGQ